jgi:hypothetical protein
MTAGARASAWRAHALTKFEKVSNLKLFCFGCLVIINRNFYLNFLNYFQRGSVIPFPIGFCFMQVAI